jgi:kumamolisin
MASRVRKKPSVAKPRRTAPKVSSKASPKASSGETFLAPDEILTLSVYLRHRRPVLRRPGSAIDFAELTRRVTLTGLRAERKRILKPIVARVRRFAERQGMTVRRVDWLGRCITLRAKAADAERAFSTRLRWIEDEGDRRYYPQRQPKMPKALRPIVHAVLGLDNRKPQLSRLRENVAAEGSNGLLPSQIAALYGLTAASRGAGQCIAIIEPAGGYRPDDLAKACKAMQIDPPKIVDIDVGKGRNNPGINAKADAEVALDIQVVAGVAPEAKIVVYFTELSEPGLVAGVCRAVHGPERPDVVIITWGEPETIWPDESRLGLDPVLQDTVRLGITVVATAGDDLARERMSGGKVYVNYPASSPYVLACGGTQITLDAAGSAISDEVVWNDRGVRGTGGGISEKYLMPSFQTAAHLPGSLNDGKAGRGVPDVAAAAAQVNGYRIFLDGADTVASGTSAVAPLWGAFIALINAERGKALGFVNERLYQAPGLLKPILSGDNIDTMSGLGYSAGPGPGWNACAGLGSPRGAAIVEALTAVA